MSENISNVTYDSAQSAYNKIQEFFNSHQFGEEHASLIQQHEKLGDYLDSMDLAAIESDSNDLDKLHSEFADIKNKADKVIEDLNEVINYISTASKVSSSLNQLLTSIAKIVV